MLTRKIVRLLTTYAITRWILNRFYLRFNLGQLADFHNRFSLIHREYDDLAIDSEKLNVQDGVWKVMFAGEKLLMPITKNRIWLDWDLALSIVGHDPEIKETYANLLGQIDMFVDIGANYGTHSLLFLKHGIPTMTFEPNKNCHPYFEEICRLNGTESEIETVALGKEDGQVELNYPIRNTWLGTTSTKEAIELKKYCECVSDAVEIRKLDDYRLLMDGRLLIKIDAEGSELDILLGAEEVMKKHPLIIFESWSRDENRGDIYDFFAERNYRVYPLPWPKSKNLMKDVFIHFGATNFIAVPN